jgi:hypothetical protein
MLRLTPIKPSVFSSLVFLCGHGYVLAHIANLAFFNRDLDRDVFPSLEPAEGAGF